MSTFIIMHRFTRISWSLSSSSTGISGGSPAGRSKMSNEAAARPLLRCAFASDISCFSSSVRRSLNWNCGDWLDGYAPLAFYLVVLGATPSSEITLLDFQAKICIATANDSYLQWCCVRRDRASVVHQMSFAWRKFHWLGMDIYVLTFRSMIFAPGSVGSNLNFDIGDAVSIFLAGIDVVAGLV